MPAASKPKVPYCGFGRGTGAGAVVSAAEAATAGGAIWASRVAQPPRMVLAAKATSKGRIDAYLPSTPANYRSARGNPPNPLAERAGRNAETLSPPGYPRLPPLAPFAREPPPPK